MSPAFPTRAADLPLPRIYFHPPSGTTVLPLLSPLLPYSLPLLRRIQFHVRSPHSYILASFPPPLIGRTITTEVASTTFPLTAKSLPSHFVIAFVDRSREPETEVWFFTSLELPEGWKDIIDRTNSLGSWEDVLARVGLDGKNVDAQTGNEDGGIGLGRGGTWGLGDEEGKPEDMLAIYNARSQSQSETAEQNGAAKEAESQRQCASCGQDGHLNTNKKQCPLLSSSLQDISEKEATEIIRTQLLSLFKTIRHLPPSSKPDMESLDQTKATTSTTLGAGAVDMHPSPPSPSPPGRTDPPHILVGAIHARNVVALTPTGIFTRYTVPNHKYLFHIPSLPETRPLPDTLEFGPVAEAFFPLVRSRTAIARQDRTLRLCESLAVYERPTDPQTSPSENKETSATSLPPAAWAFLGPDSSIMSLTTEEAYRGRGLAKALTTQLIRQKMSSFGDEPYGHSDVSFDNATSIGVARSLGGVYCWTVYWAHVDLERL